MAFRIEITGLAEAREKCNPVAFRRLLLGALKPGFEPMRAAIQSVAPPGKKNSRATITTRIRERWGEFVILITSRGFLHIVDVGHWIVSGGRADTGQTPRWAGRALGLVTGGRLRTAARGTRVGVVAPRNFVRPAVMSTEAEVIALIEQRVAAAFNAR